MTIRVTSSDGSSLVSDPPARPLSGRGDVRRTKLLSALDGLLRERSFDSISIGEISKRADVSRSAFYFYFENKAAAVAALFSHMNDQVSMVASDVFAAEGPPAARFDRQIRGIVAAWREHRDQYRVMLDARNTDVGVREMWDAHRRSYVGNVAKMIDAERSAGHAPRGPDSYALATVLLELNDLALQRLALDDPLPLEDRIEALVVVWLRAIYAIADWPPL